VFCENTPHHGCSDATCACRAAPAAAAAAAAGGPHLGALLPSLGLGPHVITNVVMHRDIVPRAFVCDYSPVAEVLKSWLPSFKTHTGLAACKDHKVRLLLFWGTGLLLFREEGAVTSLCRAFPLALKTQPLKPLTLSAAS